MHVVARGNEGGQRVRERRQVMHMHKCAKQRATEQGSTLAGNIYEVVQVKFVVKKEIRKAVRGCPAGCAK